MYLLYFLCAAFSCLSVEEKVGQLLMVHFHGEEANEDAKCLIRDQHVGGIIYYTWSNGLKDPAQVKKLSNQLQALSKIPLLLAVDQEGGRIVRIQGLTPTIGNEALGKLGHPEAAFHAAFTTGKELKEVGINLNLAPVVDVNSNPLNRVIGDRSFGSHPDFVAEFGQQAVDGYHKAGIRTCLKHFPGHGDVQVDSHVGLPVLVKSLEQLQKVELLPFAKLGDKSDAIMTAHILVPALDPDVCATLSKKTLGYLREALGFEGVIISDSLVMEGILRSASSIDEASIAALNAGCDILLLGGCGKHVMDGKPESLELTPADVKRIHAVLVNAVKTGRISKERLDDAVKRILKLKDVIYPDGRSACIDLHHS